MSDIKLIHDGPLKVQEIEVDPEDMAQSDSILAAMNGIESIKHSKWSVNGAACLRIVQPRDVVVDNLVTAHPRSGTQYIAELLVAHGLDMPHESAFKDGQRIKHALGRDGIVSWQHAGISGEWKTRVKKALIHLVRNPLDVIASTAFSLSPIAFPLMWDAIPEPDFYRLDPPMSPENRVRLAMHTYLFWNELIEGREPDLRVKLEDIVNCGPGLYQLALHLGFTPDEEIAESIGPRNCGQHVNLSVEDLMAVDDYLGSLILQMAEEYGYEL